jgi:hypothetical protein
MRTTAFTLALLAADPVAAQNTIGTIMPTPDSGQAEIRDNSGLVRGYLRPNEATGQTEILDSSGNVRGYLTPLPGGSAEISTPAFVPQPFVEPPPHRH